VEAGLSGSIDLDLNKVSVTGIGFDFSTLDGTFGIDGE
jgi:hypothetical protein